MPLIPKPARQALPMALAVALAAAVADSLAGLRAHHWYQLLAKPAWAVPAGWIEPAWTGAYITMALAAWLILRKEGWQSARGVLHLWGLQLVASALWPGLFFVLRKPGLAAAGGAVLLSLGLATTAAFWRRQRQAGLLMLPAALATAYQTVLSLAV